MKNLLLTSLLFVVAMLSANAQAQVAKQKQGLEARKFDEFTIGIGSPELRFYRNYDEVDKELEIRFARYARQLRLEAAQPYAITYSPRIVAWESYNRSIAEMRGGALRQYLTPLGFDYKNIKVIEGGYRQVATTELWIVPRGAQPPIATPTFKPEDVAYCPFVRVDSLPYVPKTNGSIEFKAAVSVNDSKVQPVFDWKVSQGKIVRGQGTDTIAVDLPADASGEVIAKVDLSGYSLECPVESTTAISKTAIGVSHFKFDEFGNIHNGDAKARLDALTITLQNDPNLQVHVVIYGGRFGSSSEVSRRQIFIRDYLIESRGIAGERIILVNGGYRNELSGELWLSLKGTNAPLLTPTVDKKYVSIKK